MLAGFQICISVPLKNTICKTRLYFYSKKTSIKDETYRQYDRLPIHQLTLNAIKLVVVSDLMGTLIYQKLASTVYHMIQV